MTLRELAELVELSMGPDETLDAAICRAAFPFLDLSWHDHLRFTETLGDASLLVPWRQRWRVSVIPGSGRAYAQVGNELAYGCGRSAALALTAASLYARARRCRAIPSAGASSIPPLRDRAAAGTPRACSRTGSSPGSLA